MTSFKWRFHGNPLLACAGEIYSNTWLDQKLWVVETLICDQIRNLKKCGPVPILRDFGSHQVCKLAYVEWQFQMNSYLKVFQHRQLKRQPSFKGSTVQVHNAGYACRIRRRGGTKRYNATLKTEATLKAHRKITNTAEVLKDIREPRNNILLGGRQVCVITWERGPRSTSCRPKAFSSSCSIIKV